MFINRGLVERVMTQSGKPREEVVKLLQEARQRKKLSIIADTPVIPNPFQKLKIHIPPKIDTTAAIIQNPHLDNKNELYHILITHLELNHPEYTKGENLDNILQHTLSYLQQLNNNIPLPMYFKKSIHRFIFQFKLTPFFSTPISFDSTFKIPDINQKTPNISEELLVKHIKDILLEYKDVLYMMTPRNVISLLEGMLHTQLDDYKSFIKQTIKNNLPQTPQTPQTPNQSIRKEETNANLINLPIQEEDLQFELPVQEEIQLELPIETKSKKSKKSKTVKRKSKKSKKSKSVKRKSKKSKKSKSVKSKKSKKSKSVKRKSKKSKKSKSVKSKKSKKSKSKSKKSVKRKSKKSKKSKSKSKKSVKRKSKKSKKSKSKSKSKKSVKRKSKKSKKSKSVKRKSKKSKKSKSVKRKSKKSKKSKSVKKSKKSKSKPKSKKSKSVKKSKKSKSVKKSKKSKSVKRKSKKSKKSKSVKKSKKSKSVKKSKKSKSKKSKKTKSVKKK